MFYDKNRSATRSYGRHQYILKRIRNIGAVVLLIGAIVASILITTRMRSGNTIERRELIRVWNAGDYEQAYFISKNILEQRPVDYFYLTINGFSAFQLGISQINNHNRLVFIDESIFSLRKAMVNHSASNDGRVYYVLGKAYGYKGNEYSDLAIKYLEKAASLSYEASDIPEFLGIAYAASGDYRSSIKAFSQAFVKDKAPSDNLLLSIARSYIAMEEYDMATGYLKRCIEISPDSKSVVIAKMLLAEILIIYGDLDAAEEYYASILNETGENAEVRFQLGEIYHLRGDNTRARAEWRIAYRQDPAHAKARARLNI